jgi:hypothetical protein
MDGSDPFEDIVLDEDPEKVANTELFTIPQIILQYIRVFSTVLAWQSKHSRVAIRSYL